MPVISARWSHKTLPGCPTTNVVLTSRPWARGRNTSTTSTHGTDPQTYCKNFVRKHDHESFLISQFWPKEAQGGYFALKAFSVELAKVYDVTSSPMIGKMRMQFWRDAITEISNVLDKGRPPRHPVVLALHEASQRAHLPAYHLKRIIDARETELDNPTHMTLSSLTAHAESTSSTLLYLLLSLLSLPSSTLSHAASHLGTAQTFTTLLRSLPFHASKGTMIIPAEITAKHGVRQEDVFRREVPDGEDKKAMEDAVFEFATRANDHLIIARDTFRENGQVVPREAVPVFLAAIPVSLFLERLEAVNFNVFHPSMQKKDWKLPWRIWRGFYKRNF